MAAIDGIQADIDSYSQNAEIVKQLVLDRLLMDEVISEDVHDKYSSNWNIILVKKSWFKVWAKKFDKSDGWYYKFVKFED